MPSIGKQDLLQRLEPVVERRLLAREPAADTLRDELSLAHDALGWVHGDARRLDELDGAAFGELEEWLEALPGELAGAGLATEAAALCTKLSALARPEHFLSEAALLLAGAGRRDAAVPLVLLNLERFERSAYILRRGGEALALLGDVAQAEELYREAAQVADAYDEPDEAIAAIDRLAPLLEERGEDDEAGELRARREELDTLGGEAAELFGATGEEPGVDGVARALVEPGSDVERLARLSAQLVEFGRREEFEAEVELAVQRYWGPGTTRDDIDYVDEDWEVSAFLEWLVYDFRLGRGPTLAARFVERRRRLLDEIDRTLLDRAAASYLGLYELVGESSPGTWQVRDVLGDDTVRVLVDSESEGLRAGDVVAGRLVELDAHPQFLGGVIGIEPDRTTTLRARLDALRAKEPRRPWAELLKENGEVFHQVATPDEHREGPS